MTRTVITAVSAGYARSWSRVNAIREVLQNALDLRTERGVDLRLHWEDGLGVVEDDGPGLEPRHLAFGVSDKGERTIGQFGEGLKLAALVFAREGAAFEVKTRDLVITPAMVRDDTLETEVLALNLRRVDHPRHGTRVTLACTREEWDRARSGFAALVEHEMERLDRGLTLPPGRVYVNGALAWEGEALFSYHLADKAAVGRDRDLADLSRLRQGIQGLLLAAASPRVAEAVLASAARQDSACLEWSFPWSRWAEPADLGLWREAARRLWGERACLDSTQAAVNSQAAWEGWTLVHPHSHARGLLLAVGLPPAEEAVRAKPQASPLNPMRELTPAELRVLHRALRVVSRQFAAPGRVYVVEGLRKGDREVEALCDPATGATYLNRRALMSLEVAVEALIHEAIHRQTGAGDCDPEFQQAACRLAARGLLRGLRA